MAKTTVHTTIKKPMPVNRHHKADSAPFLAVNLAKAKPEDLRKQLKVSKSNALKTLKLLKENPEASIALLTIVNKINVRDAQKLRRNVLTPSDTRFAIQDVRPAQKYLWSFKQLGFIADIENPAKKELVFLTVTVLWQGKPFTVEKVLQKKDYRNGKITISFNEKQILPPGPATFIVEIYDNNGGKSMFRTTCVVLPSNPLSLSISPRSYFVTGTYSIRGYFNTSTNKYITNIYVNIYNGNAASVVINKTAVWQFWNGGVGGSLVESGNASWSNNITIGAYNTWQGTISFSSPPGSGVYNTYHSKEDMTLKIQMTSTNGSVIADTLTCRVMLGYGVDIIRVASDTFVGQEYTDLYDAVDVCQDIYEKRDITLRGVGRYHIDDADAGGYGIINSENECRDMWSDWSAAPGGNYIDVFVCHDFSGTGFDGLAGDIPGPTSHSGKKSGVAVDKTGYVDGTGKKRIHVDYLGMLIGHELGHYLGLSHLSVAGNLLHPSSGTYDTNLTYDQYRDMLGFGWLFVV